MKDKISKETVRERLKYPYEIKVKMTERRLSEFITYYGESGVVVCISGGLDSTAAMHFIHKRYPDVEAICVLGIECRDNIEMVMKIRDEWGVNVNIAKPRKSQQAVLKEFGYPIVSKRAAKSLNHLQNPTEEINNSNNKVVECKNNYIIFSSGNQYTYMEENKSIYKNKIKLCDNVEKCEFSYKYQDSNYIINIEFKSGKVDKTGKNMMTYTIKR